MGDYYTRRMSAGHHVLYSSGGVIVGRIWNHPRVFPRAWHVHPVGDEWSRPEHFTTLREARAWLEAFAEGFDRAAEHLS